MLIDWILKNIMDMDQEDQSGKTQWTKYYLTVYFISFIWDVKRNLYCIRRTDFFTACRRWLACKNQMALSSRKHCYLCCHTICIEKFFCELTVYL